MRRLNFRVFALAAAMTCLHSLSSSAQAGTSTTTIAVTASVTAYCSVSANALAFGTYSSASGTTANTSVTVQCTSGASYNVGLDAGTTTGATVSARLLSGPSSNTLTYGLYSNAAMTTVWGNTIGTNTVTGTGNGSSQTLTVYGKIASGQYPVAGSYTDTVTVTVSY